MQKNEINSSFANTTQGFLQGTAEMRFKPESELKSSPPSGHWPW